MSWIERRNRLELFAAIMRQRHVIEVTPDITNQVLEALIEVIAQMNEDLANK